jgi:SAM-dependent methyltransferase
LSELADYGYDAPYALVIFGVIGTAGVMGALVGWRDGDRRLTAVMSLYAVFFLGQAISFYYTTRRGKFAVWNSILDGLQLRGDERVAIETGDMRSLPFADGSFDLVLSSLAIHNIRGRRDRAKAVAEAWRVLKPGGRLLIADIRSTALYAKTLETLGAVTTIRRLGWRFWYGNPFAATSLVTASKPLPRG